MSHNRVLSDNIQASVDERKAEQAFAAHRALLLAEVDNQSLRNNPYWILLRQDAYERFAAAMGER